MAIDQRTPEEIAYDNLKNGRAYVKPTFTSEYTQTERRRYTYGTAQIDVDEDGDGNIQGGRLTLAGNVIGLDAAAFQGVIDLMSLLHRHEAQLTIGVFCQDGDGENEPPLTIGGIEAAYRTEWDNDAIHETENRLCRTMTRMGLTLDQQRDLMGHVADLAVSVNCQGWARGLHDGKKAMFEEVDAIFKEVDADRSAAIRIERSANDTAFYHGRVMLCLQDTPGYAQMTACDITALELEDVERDIHDINILLSDARVKEAIAEWKGKHTA